jgi:YidC/Oxa1 family membrane protein insertase
LTPVIAQGFLGIESFNPPWDIFFLPLFNLMIALYKLPLVDFAIAIILFTIVIRTLLAPLFVRQISSQKEMQRMQPLVREVQRKHKGNRQKIYEETQALYREHGVNPAAGCLPVLLQLPILFALYQALIRASGTINFTTGSEEQADALAAWVERAQITPLGNNNYAVPVDGPCNAPEGMSSLLPMNCQLITPVKLDLPVDTVIEWLTNPFTGVSLNLATVDTAFAIPLFGGFALSLLAVIAAILQFVQVKMTAPPPNAEDPTSSMTSTMTYTFPLLTIFWGGIFPSGLILYWIVYTAYLVIQQFLIMGWGNLFPVFGWQPRWAPSPNTGITPAAPPKRDGSSAAPASDTGPNPNPRASSSGGGRTNSRPGNRRPGSAKRRGRRR